MQVYSAMQPVLIPQVRPSKWKGLPSEPQDAEYSGVRVGQGQNVNDKDTEPTKKV